MAATVSVALVLATALPGLALAGVTDTEMSPTDGYDIHVTVGRHDSTHLDAQMDHYCKLDSRTVAVYASYTHMTTTPCPAPARSSPRSSSS